MDEKGWEFWIDVGGTFTDCIARSPDDTLQTVKVLSSGVAKGRVESMAPPNSVFDSARQSDPDRFWIGYDLRFVDPEGTTIQTARITGFKPRLGEWTLDRSLDSRIAPGTRYEVTAHEEAPILAIRHVLGLALSDPIPRCAVRLGTTRGTNALLTRRGARTAFITTRGFGDVLLIGNQARPRLFDLAIRKPEPLFERVVEVDERIDADGCVLREPDQSALRQELEELKTAGIESIGICLLHSYANAAHESIVERIAREVGFTEVSTSNRLAPLIKIVSRGDTTVMDAYLNPILRQYVAGMHAAMVGRGPESRVQSRPSTLNPQPSTLNPRPSTLDPQPSK